MFLCVTDIKFEEFNVSKQLELQLFTDNINNIISILITELVLKHFNLGEKWKNILLSLKLY